MGLPTNKHNFWEAHPEGISLRNWFKTYIRRIFLLDEAMFLLMGKIEGKTEGKPFFFSDGSKHHGFSVKGRCSFEAIHSE
jgi:hypothetical protein